MDLDIDFTPIIKLIQNALLIQNGFHYLNVKRKPMKLLEDIVIPVQFSRSVMSCSLGRHGL